MTEPLTTLIPKSKIIRFWSVVTVTIGIAGTGIGYISSQTVLTPPATSLLLHQQGVIAEVRGDLESIEDRVVNLEQQTTKLTTEIEQLKSK